MNDNPLRIEQQQTAYKWRNIAEIEATATGVNIELTREYDSGREDVIMIKLEESDVDRLIGWLAAWRYGRK